MALLGRIIKRLLILVILLAAAGLFAAWYVGAWNLIFPNQEHDAIAPAIPTDLAGPSVLVFSKTNAFRHKDGIEEGGAKALRELAQQRGWGVFHTENGAVFNAADLEHFTAVVFLNASGDMLSAAQERAFQAWMEQGGGWLGIHAAGDSSHAGWQWYRDALIGADFTAHIMGPQFQFATVLMENHQHPMVNGLPNIWKHDEEWYSWEKSPRVEGFTILATLDEGSYSPVQKIFGTEVDLSMGDHPVVWANCVGEGRSVYMAMGHRASAFEQRQVRKLLANALGWLLTDAGTCNGALIAE